MAFINKSSRDVRSPGLYDEIASKYRLQPAAINSKITPRNEPSSKPALRLSFSLTSPTYSWLRILSCGIPVRLGIEPRHGAVMMQRTDAVEGAAAAPDLLHLARQRDRVGRVIPAGQRERENTIRIQSVQQKITPADRGRALGALEEAV